MTTKDVFLVTADQNTLFLTKKYRAHLISCGNAFQYHEMQDIGYQEIRKTEDQILLVDALMSRFPLPDILHPDHLNPSRTDGLRRMYEGWKIASPIPRSPKC